MQRRYIREQIRSWHQIGARALVFVLAVSEPVRTSHPSGSRR